ncbi:glycoside hydrolase family 26 protein [uncultured Jatrophihabitans sp.]|uniref:glycoside hydrolase family 26 protein n=1 Tax=uncultured Jatrophihabitans sp. TaxID=1610747 RepID=UPI0035CBC66F
MIYARALRQLGVVMMLALSITACTGADPSGHRPSAAASRGVTRPTSNPASTQASSVAPHEPATSVPVLRRVGVSLPLNRLAGFIKTTGSVPNQLGIYQQWAAGLPFDAVAGAAAMSRGMSILVNWEPWAPQCDCAEQLDWTDRKIASGAHDAYIRAYARSVKAFTLTGGHVTLRLGHEMNGNWYPWAAGANGNTSADYIAMWRHVYIVFTAEHVPNVRWMWSPNLAYPGSVAMSALYPGDRYVDDVGLSGYNFGAGDGFHWETFSTLFQPSLDTLRRIAPRKPLYLAEIGCAPQGGNKAAWIADAFRQVNKRRYIAGITWFEQRTQRDWTIEDSPADVRAWRAGVTLLQGN